MHRSRSANTLYYLISDSAECDVGSDQVIGLHLGSGLSEAQLSGGAEAHKRRDML